MVDKLLLPSLRRPVERLRALLETPLDAATRHAIGMVVHDVKSAPETYGASAVVQLAAATGGDVATLYRHASVAVCWSLDETRRLLSARRSPSPMSWSHLVVLSGVDSRAARDQWIARCRSESLSVRKLEGLIEAESARMYAWARAERALCAAERLMEENTEDIALPPRLRERAIAVHERLQRHAERQLQRLRRRELPPERASGSYSRLPSRSRERIPAAGR